jgi:hypothetical protein
MFMVFDTPLAVCAPGARGMPWPLQRITAS